MRPAIYVENTTADSGRMRPAIYVENTTAAGERNGWGGFIIGRRCEWSTAADGARMGDNDCMTVVADPPIFPVFIDMPTRRVTFNGVDDVQRND